MPRQQPVGRGLVAVGSAGSVASLIVVYEAARGVLASGGFCSEGGAYAIAHQCNRAHTVLLLCAALGMLTFGGLLVAVTAWMRGPVVHVSLLLWVALFATLGCDFIDLGAAPPRAAGADVELIAIGAVCAVLALSGLAPLVRLFFSRVPNGGAPGRGQLGGDVLRG